MSIRAHALRHLHNAANGAYIYGQDPERMHDLIVKEWAPKLETNPVIINQLYNALNVDDKILETEFLWTTYKNPVGLAAGLLKQPLGLKFWEALWVWYIEVGSILGEPRQGNAKPRIRRYPHHQTGGLTVVNQMWLPQQWAELTAAQFQQREDDGMMPNIPVWANFTNTPRPGIKLQEQVEDIKTSMRYMWDYAKVFVINVSCPNTGENLQEQVRELLAPLIQARNELAQEKGESKPMLAKIGPVTSNDKKRLENYPHLQDNTVDQTKSMLDTFVDLGMDGVVATNTAKEHTDLKWLSPMDDNKNPRWGMSGKNLHERSLETVAIVKQHTGGSIKIVWLWGIGAGKWPAEWQQSAGDMLHAWADMVQMYSGVVNNLTSPHFANKWIASYRKSEQFISRELDQILRKVKD